MDTHKKGPNVNKSWEKIPFTLNTERVHVFEQSNVWMNGIGLLALVQTSHRANDDEGDDDDDAVL